MTARQQFEDTQLNAASNTRCERPAERAARNGWNDPLPKSQGVLQRKCACGGTPGPTGECEECRKKRQTGILQRFSSRPAASEPAIAPPVVHEVLRSPGQPLDAATREFMEPRFSHDFSHVRVHTDSAAAESARSVNAQAYTVGRDIVFDSGRYQPGHTSGLALLTHELTHAVQQSGTGHVPAGERILLGSADSPLEREADSAVRNLRPVAPGAVGPPCLQRKKWDDLPVYEERSDVINKSTGCGKMAADMKPFVTGVEGTIKFTPDATKCPKCKSIRLVQVVRTFEKPGQDYTWSGAEAPREQVKTKEDKKAGVKANYFVDHIAAGCSKGKNCSLYYRDHAPNSAVSQDGSNDGKTASVASLWDRPSGDADDIFEFETCAKCADSGANLACIDWGFQADGKGQVTLTPSSEHATPSATFSAATAAFKKYYGK
jgi:Domain of unknown function (DUF4157)